LPFRYVVSCVMMFGLLVSYSMRVNLSIAIVSMVKRDPTCSTGPNNITICTGGGGEFDWDESLKGLLLGAFFWGYIIPQVVLGVMFDKFGAKWIYFACITMCVVTTCITPVAARAGSGFLFAVRVILGFFQAPTMACAQYMVKKWAPLQERSALAFVVFVGNFLGNIVTFNLGSYLCEHGFAGGWPSVFYVTGSMAAVWLIFFIVLVDNSPEQSRFTSEAEKELIHSSMATAYQSKPPPVPWRQLLSSWPVWGIFIAHTCNNFGFYMLLTEMPSYMSKILQFNMSQSGLWSSLPYVSIAVIGGFVSFIADWFIRSKKIELITMRKICSMLGTAVPGLGLIFITVCNGNVDAILFFLIILGGFNGAGVSGYTISQIDITPNFAATIMAISNTIATLPGIAAPYVVGAFTNNHNTAEQWNKVFWLAGSIWIAGGILFTIFGSGEVQYWNDLGTRENIQSEETALSNTSQAKPKSYATNTSVNSVENK